MNALETGFSDSTTTFGKLSVKTTCEFSVPLGYTWQIFLWFLCVFVLVVGCWLLVGHVMPTRHVEVVGCNATNTNITWNEPAFDRIKPLLSKPPRDFATRTMQIPHLTTQYMDCKMIYDVEAGLSKQMAVGSRSGRVSRESSQMRSLPPKPTLNLSSCFD